MNENEYKEKENNKVYLYLFELFFLENVSLSVLTYFSQPVSLKDVTISVSLCELPFAVTQLEKQLLSFFLPENTKRLELLLAL